MCDPKRLQPVVEVGHKIAYMVNTKFWTIIEKHFLPLPCVQCNPCMYQTKLQTWHVAGQETHMESAAGKKIVTRDAQAK